MFSFLLPLAAKIISDAVNKIPDNEELGEQLINITITILNKAVKMTKTDMDDKLLLAVIEAVKARWVNTLLHWSQVANNNVWESLNTGEIYSSPLNVLTKAMLSANSATQLNMHSAVFVRTVDALELQHWTTSNHVARGDQT